MLQSQREVAAGGDPLSQGGGHTRVEDPSRPGEGSVACLWFMLYWCSGSHCT